MMNWPGGGGLSADFIVMEWQTGTRYIVREEISTGRNTRFFKPSRQTPVYFLVFVDLPKETLKEAGQNPGNIVPTPPGI